MIITHTVIMSVKPSVKQSQKVVKYTFKENYEIKVMILIQNSYKHVFIQFYTPEHMSNVVTKIIVLILLRFDL